MYFSSDNASGASQKILDAILAANAGDALPYGADDWSKAAEHKVSEVFERDCAVFLVPTGTAANALALAAFTPPYGAVFCHEDAHVMDDECGAPEFFTSGAKLVGMPGGRGKITPEVLARTLAAYPRGLVKQVQPATLTLSQATESGTIYKTAEIAELAEAAHRKGVAVHMDGARFSNALVSLGCTPAEMTWKSGVDVLSLGGTKNGAIMCEAVVFFDRERASDFLYLRKRGGHTVSKGRFLGAQLLAWLDGGHWLDLARHANAQAHALASGLRSVPGVRLPWEPQVNEVFAILPGKVNKSLKDAGARYYDWGGRGLDDSDALRDGEVLVRMVTSFATTPEHVSQCCAIARDAAA
jgi:threonine aldolase